jgi:DNA polymerase sigma
MPKRRAPSVKFTHHRVRPPQYTKAEITGFKEQIISLKAHIVILSEEIKNRKAQIRGLQKIVKEN